MIGVQDGVVDIVLLSVLASRLNTFEDTPNHAASIIIIITFHI
jgi:hypothetical protein